MTRDEFKEFLEKNNINIQFKIEGRDQDLVGSFYWFDEHLFVSHKIEFPYTNINDLSTERLKDIFFQILKNESILENLRDKIISSLKIDGIEICEVESSKKEEDNSAGPIVTGCIKMPSIREETLDTAKKCVMGDREQDYGTPESNFATIASFWSDYLDMDISAQQVADMMILMKISRIKNGGGTGDSYVDIAGYAACGNEILSKKG